MCFQLERVGDMVRDWIEPKDRERVMFHGANAYGMNSTHAVQRPVDFIPWKKITMALSTRK